MSKKQTAGEKIMAASVGRDVKEFRVSPLYPMERKTAARIDAAIGRERIKRDRLWCNEIQQYVGEIIATKIIDAIERHDERTPE